jgi:hypothetical protein
LSESLIVHCDYCPAIKKETNHWFRVYRMYDEDGNPVGVSIVPRSVRKSFFTRNTGAYALLDNLWGDSVKDACGETCAQKALSKFFISGEI